MGIFCQVLIELSDRKTSIFLFPYNNLSKYQWIFTKLDTCLEMWRSGLGLMHIHVQATTVQGPVVQSVISLTSLLVVKMLTAPVRTVSNSQLFFLKNCE